MPFAGKLDPKNRWARLASIMLWDKIEEIDLRTMSTETGCKAIPVRVAFGAIDINARKSYLNISKSKRWTSKSFEKASENS